MHTLFWAQQPWLVNHCIFLCDTFWVVVPKAAMAHGQVPGEPQCEPPSPFILPSQAGRSNLISAKETEFKHPSPPCSRNLLHRDLLSVLQSMGGSSDLRIKLPVKNKNSSKVENANIPVFPACTPAAPHEVTGRRSWAFSWKQHISCQRGALVGTLAWDTTENRHPRP